MSQEPKTPKEENISEEETPKEPKKSVDLLKRYSRPIIIGVCVGVAVVGAAFMALDGLKSDKDDTTEEGSVEDLTEEVTEEE